MRFSFRKIICLATLVSMISLSPGLCRAGDRSQLEILGFSSDGAFIAYERYGVEDGSGIPYSEIYCVDIAKNEFLSKKIELRGSEGDDRPHMLDSLRIVNQERAAGLLKKAGILLNEKGVLLYYRPISDKTAAGNRVRFAMPYGPFSSATQAIFELELEERSAGKQCMDFDAKMFGIKLKYKQQAHYLQNDSRLPRSRGCVYKYRIERIVSHGKHSLAIFLFAFKPGFEGPTVRHLVVTGDLKTFDWTKNE